MHSLLNMHLNKESQDLQLYNVFVRAGRYDSIIVIPRYVNSPILILKLFMLYDFIVIDIIAI